VYRDDKDAADALANQLRRDNADLEREKTDLERENARLREELAAKAAPTPATSNQPATRGNKRKLSRAERKRANANRMAGSSRDTDEHRAGAEPKKPRAKVNHYSRSTGFNYAVRIACGVATAIVAFSLVYALNPIFHPGAPSLYHAIMCALISQVWSLMFIAQPLLGWWPDADKSGGYRQFSTRERIGWVLGGILGVLLTVLLISLAGSRASDV